LINNRACTGFARLICAPWALTHPFRGIAHDSIVYTLFPVARLHPESIGHDFSISLGAQDHYTIFTPLYAGIINALGIDAAAALITFITQAAFLWVCWRLGRRFIQPALMLLVLAPLVIRPTYYGGGLVFS